MSDIIGKLFSRLSRYDWFTNIMPGLFLLGLLRKIGVNIAANSILEEFGIIFFLGVVCSRIGATCVEQVARWCGLFESYEDYIDWSNANKDKADMLVRNSNWFRSLCGMSIVLGGIFALKLISCNWMSHNVKIWCADLVLLLLFADSYRRQLSFTTQRIQKYKKDKESGQLTDRK